MTLFLLAITTFLTTLAGGLLALKGQNKLHRYLGVTAGVLLGVVAFDLLPEIFEQVSENNLSTTAPMIALVVGFLLFHIVEKSILIHHNHEAGYEIHNHPHVGIASALAIIGHSLLDGIAIGVGFQAGAGVGVTIAIAVIAHNFTDGLNTVNLMLINNNRSRRAFIFLLINAVAPIVGILIATVLNLSDAGLTLYLGFFAGFLLYIGASEILPEAHRKNSSYLTISLTILGAAFIFVVTSLNHH